MMLMTSECVSTFDLHPARNLADMVLKTPRWPAFPEFVRIGRGMTSVEIGNRTFVQTIKDALSEVACGAKRNQILHAD